jgi:uncharacterized protein
MDRRGPVAQNPGASWPQPHPTGTQPLFPQLPAADLALCAVFVLVAYFIRGIVGFGSGLIAISLLALLLPLSVAVPAVALTDYLASAGQGIGNRRAVLWASIWPLLPFMLSGVLTALWLFQQVDPGLLTRGLGAFVIGYALYTLSGLHPGRIEGARRAAPLGALGALIGTLFGTATAATIFLIEGSTRLVGYLGSGFFTRDALTLSALALPLMVLGLYAGHQVHTRVSETTFKRLISLLLVASGLALMLK